jgi:DNA-binding MarR family transcriptional regulator
MIADAMTSAPAVPRSPELDPPGRVTARTAGDDSAALALWAALASAHAALIGRLDPETADCAVIGTDTIEVLLPLSLAPDQRLRMHELADRSHLTRSGLTRRVDKLVADRLVEREHCDADRRGAYARLTRAGADELARALPYHVDAVAQHLAARLSPAEVATLTALLERLP